MSNNSSLTDSSRMGVKVSCMTVSYAVSGAILAFFLLGLAGGVTGGVVVAVS